MGLESIFTKTVLVLESILVRTAFSSVHVINRLVKQIVGFGLVFFIVFFSGGEILKAGFMIRPNY